MSGNDFELTSPEPKRRVVAKEPLYSMLIECDPAALRYLYKNLLQYDNESQLKDFYSEVGLDRATYIDQVHLAMVTRDLI